MIGLYRALPLFPAYNLSHGNNVSSGGVGQYYSATLPSVPTSGIYFALRCSPGSVSTGVGWTNNSYNVAAKLWFADGSSLLLGGLLLNSLISARFVGETTLTVNTNRPVARAHSMLFVSISNAQAACHFNSVFLGNVAVSGSPLVQIEFGPSASDVRSTPSASCCWFISEAVIGAVPTDQSRAFALRSYRNTIYAWDFSKLSAGVIPPFKGNVNILHTQVGPFSPQTINIGNL